MANPSRNPAEDVSKSANQTADRIEQAVRTGDKEAYTKAMGEVNAFRDKHTPEETKVYSATVTKRLEEDKVLPTVSLFEAKTNFSKIDTSGNGRLEAGELDLYKNRRDVNEVQAAFVANIQKNYDTIRNYSKWGETWYGGNSKAIADQDINDGVEQQRAIMNLHAPGKDGVSLYDKLSKDTQGNIVGGTFDAALAGDNAVARTLTPEDRQTILTLQKNQPTFSFNDFNKNALDKFERESGLDPNVVQNQKRAARAETHVSIGDLPPRQEQMQKDYEREQGLTKEKTTAQIGTAERLNTPGREHRPYYPELEAGRREAADRARMQEGTRQKLHDDKINQALTIGKGESYAHAAERLLSLAGHKDFSRAELKQVSHQLWVADQRRKGGELRVGQKLNLDLNLRDNPVLAKLFDGSDL